MKQALGILMLLAFFGLLFAALAAKYGVGETALSFLVGSGITAWIFIAVHFLCHKHFERGE